MNIDAPTTLKLWLERNSTTILELQIRAELKIDPDGKVVDKAALFLEGRRLLCSLTVWGNGMIEYIVVDGDSGDDVCSVDFECADKECVYAKLDEFLDDLRLRLVAFS